MKAGNFANDGPSTALTMAYAAPPVRRRTTPTPDTFDEAGRHLHEPSTPPP
jgi:hypothetical protein